MIIQQNHDGLAQKSGYPQSDLNEIHGSWFDKKNTVVLMDDKLKTENLQLAFRIRKEGRLMLVIRNFYVRNEFRSCC